MAAAGLAGLFLSGCWLGDAGIGLPRQRNGETYPGDRHEVAGVLEVADNGCLKMKLGGTSYFVIWPAGASQADRVRLPNGEKVAEGDTVIGIGALTPTRPLLTDRNGYWANAIGYCAPSATEVLVLDTARRGL